MKYHFLVLFFLVAQLFASFNSTAQVLENVKAPTMPAAVLIGSQANEISRPKTLNALEAALLNNFLDSAQNMIIPNNYALEFSPFMLSKRTNFNYLKYLEDSFHNNLWRNLSLSVASTNNYIINDSLKLRALGFGLRTVPIVGKVDSSLISKYTSIVNLYQSLKDAEASMRIVFDAYLEIAWDTMMLADSTIVIDAFSISGLSKFMHSFTDFTFSKEQLRWFDDVINKLPETVNRDNLEEHFVDVFKEQHSQKAYADFKRLLDAVKTERYGLRWELDAAMSLGFPTNDFTYSIVPSYGIWSNFSYKPGKKLDPMNKDVRVPGNYEFIALVRWINNNSSFINKYKPTDTARFKPGGVLDFGLRAIWARDRFSVELEYIFRYNQNREYVTLNGQEYSRTVNSNSSKYILNLNYTVSKNMILSFNLGKNYDYFQRDLGNLIAGFALNFGLGGVGKSELIDAALREVNR